MLIFIFLLIKKDMINLQTLHNFNNFCTYNIFPNNNRPINYLPYNLYETENEIYIEHIDKPDAIKISRKNPNLIERIYNKYSVQHFIFKKFQAFGIIGIFNLNFIKYLGYVSSAEEIANTVGYKVYVINSIELLKINNINESPFLDNFKTNIKKLFLTKNFYFSIDYNISIPYNQFNRDSRTNNKFLMNYSLLKPFLDNNIPEHFYHQIIFGFVSSQNDIPMGNNLSNVMDIAIIERYINGNIRTNNNNLVYIKQIELITIFKDTKNILKKTICSHITYESSESIYSIKAFSPFKMTLVEELNKFKNVFCFISSINNKISERSYKDVINAYNKNCLDNRINFEKKNSKDFDYYFDNIVQKNLFWFIDINNDNFKNKICFETIKRLFWKLISREINQQGLNINIGQLDKNNGGMIYKKYDLLYKIYKEDLNNKRLLLNKDNKKIPEVLDEYLSPNCNLVNNQNFNLEEELISDDIYNKLKILCVTWNIGGNKLNHDVDISEIFTRNYFYIKGQSPDIIVVSLQEIVSLNIFTSLKLKDNETIIDNLKNKLKASLNKIFPDQNYKASTPLNMVGLLSIIFFKKTISKDINFNNHIKIEKGNYNLGNKGYIITSFQYKEKTFSIAGCHFEAGEGDIKNKKRINTMKEILNQEIKTQTNSIIKYNESDFWIILGDLNFRLEILYNDVIDLIQNRNFEALYSMDQFHLAYENESNSFLKNNVNEGKINFLPTYKFENNSDNYDYIKNKVPSYCDRIFYCKKNGIKIRSYESVMYLKISDHRPVSAAFEFFWDKGNK